MYLKKCYGINICNSISNRFQNTLTLNQRLSNRGAHPLWGNDMMLGGAYDPGNGYTYKIFIGNDTVYSDLGRKMFSFTMGGGLKT